MKRTLLIAILFSIGFSYGQQFKFGTKVGGNFATIPIIFSGTDVTLATVPDNRMFIGFHAGGFIEMGISERITFQSELLFSFEGSKYESNASGSDFGFDYTENSKSTIKTSYIHFPFLLKYYPTYTLYFSAGPKVGVLVMAKQDSNYTYTSNGNTEIESIKGEDVKDQLNRLNIAASFGAGYFFTDTIFAEIRYDLGLSNVYKDIKEEYNGVQYTFEPKSKINNLQISLGYRF
ncbi:MAG: hypothetical protein CMP76_00240 [Flavobacterium sp.]|uniref:porin family protein n=1 Tax=Flavobacterium sp. TaxID=239 RepID=UPI000C4D72AC|nr:porin family protein [Flavobacterium sp.]MBF01703.1 hypothetical protein [Flavobacterium sp.]